MIVWFFAPETVDPILSKEPDVTRGLRKHLRGQRAKKETRAQEIEYFPQSYKAELDPDPGTPPPSVYHPEASSSLSLNSHSVLLAFQ